MVILPCGVPGNGVQLDPGAKAMSRRDAVVSLLEGCRSMRQLKQLHGHMIATSLSRDVLPLSRLLDFCTDADSGDLDYARSVFLRLDRPSTFIWNSMIRGFSTGGLPGEAQATYRDMQRRGYRPDHFTFPFVLKACAATYDHPLSGCVHGRVVRTGYASDLYVSSSLIHAYVACGDMESAETLFGETPHRNVVGWTTMISGYVKMSRPGDAIRLFGEMELAGVQANEVTMVNVLAACAQTRDLGTGRWVHRQIRRMGSTVLQSNAIIATAVVDMYARCGSLMTARELFDRMPQRNEATWNAMVTAYNQYERSDEVMELFAEMRTSGVKLDKVTLLALLGACTQRGDRRFGQGVHALVEKISDSQDLAIQTTLLDMYAKTGDAHSALQLFSGLKGRDVVAWTGMVTGLAIHGRGPEAIDLFEAMQKDDGVAPDGIAFIGVLSACSYSGLVDEGHRYFDEMRSVHGIVPTLQHYGCMVDLLSRAGHLSEAEKFVESMPIMPNIAIWGAMLSGCRIHSDFDLAERLGYRIAELNPGGSGAFVLLSNVYAGRGRWDDVGWARASLRHNKVNKIVGYSSIGV